MSCKMIDKYVAWLRKNIECHPINDELFKIEFPFSDIFGDLISVYIKKEKNDKIYINDNGIVLANMRMSGLNIDDELSGDHFRNIINNYGVEYNRETNKIYLTTNIDDFPEDVNDMIQAIIYFNSLGYKSKPAQGPTFRSMFKSYLDEYEIKYTEIEIEGKGDLKHDFFKIGSSKTDKYVRTSGPSKNAIESTLFVYSDTEHIISDFEKIVVINDIKSNPSDRMLKALNNYNIDHILWSNKDELYNRLTA